MGWDEYKVYAGIVMSILPTSLQHTGALGVSKDFVGYSIFHPSKIKPQKAQVIQE